MNEETDIWKLVKNEFGFLQIYRRNSSVILRCQFTYFTYKTVHQNQHRRITELFLLKTWKIHRLPLQVHPDI